MTTSQDSIRKTEVLEALIQLNEEFLSTENCWEFETFGPYLEKRFRFLSELQELDNKIGTEPSVDEATHWLELLRRVESLDIQVGDVLEFQKTALRNHAKSTDQQDKERTEPKKLDPLQSIHSAAITQAALKFGPARKDS